MGMEDVSDLELVKAYRQGTASGQEVMGRLLQKIDLQDRADEILHRKNGSQLTDEDGQPLRAIDYLQVAGNHDRALPAILGFTAMDKSDPEKYNAYRNVIRKNVEYYLPPKPDSEI